MTPTKSAFYLNFSQREGKGVKLHRTAIQALLECDDMQILITNMVSMILKMNYGTILLILSYFCSSTLELHAVYAN